MKVLYVDQFGKTSGCYSLPQAQLIYEKENIDITEFISDNIDFSTDKYSIKIKKGFSGAYSGNSIRKAKNYIKALFELEEYIRKNRFDIVHLQWFSLPWIEWIFVRRIKRYSRVVVTIHDVIPFNNRPFEMASLNRIYRYSDYLLFHTNYAVEEFRRNYSARIPYEVITQGFCLKSNYIRIDKLVARQHFGIPENAVVFLYYGTIRESKGLDVLIEAIGEASKINDNVFLLAGGAFQRVNPDKYYELVKKNLNESNSKVLFDFVPSEEEKLYFSAADVSVLPYREITQSGVAQNALMYDLPIIATDIGDMKEVARDGINGELIDVDNKDMLVDKILKLACDKKLVEKYSSASRVLSETEFSLENKSHIVSEVYRKIYHW